MEKRYDSNSDIQNEIERIMFEKIKNIFDLSDLERNTKLQIDVESYICPDLYSENKMIIGEIHAHIGKLKPAQIDKVSADVLKMILFEKIKGVEYRKIIAVCDKEEYKQLSGKSIIASAIREFGVEIVLTEIDESDRKNLSYAMKKQNLL